jgi:hypothetical protein
MNIWKWILFYIYSGIAFGALIKNWAGLLVSVGDTSPTRDSVREKIIEESQRLGDMMSEATTLSLISTYNRQILDTYEHAKQRQAEALRVVEAANKKGA